MKRKLSIHVKVILTFLVALFVFSVIVPLVSAPIPGQLYGWYVVTTLFVLLLYVSSSEASWEELSSLCSVGGIFPPGQQQKCSRRADCGLSIRRRPGR
jgi:hypothetical protein